MRRRTRGREALQERHLRRALPRRHRQGTRTDILSDFKQSRWDVVIATDLAARGIDIAQLPVVVNYDLPRSPTDYIHRIGRTGRAGESGLAMSFVSAATEAHFRLIEKRQGLSLPRERIEGFEPTEVAPPVVDAPGTGASRARGRARRTSCARRRRPRKSEKGAKGAKAATDAER
jgi:ATP-dependent RNA helicase RhlE